MSKAMDDIAIERFRQVTEEGWTPEHDDWHDKGELAMAAAAYAFMGGLTDRLRVEYAKDYWGPFLSFLRQHIWPSAFGWYMFKPKDRRRDLVRAGALIVAEIERIDRGGETNAHR